MGISRFAVHQPKSLEESIGLLERYGDDAAPLAGGTALLIDLRHGDRRAHHLVSLWDVPGLAGVRSNGGLHLGALTTISNAAEAISNRPVLSGLQEASWAVGSLQVRNVATLGGNICKASAGADMVPPLLCLDTELILAGPRGERQTPLDGFLTGPDQTALLAAEVLTGFHLPLPPPRTGTAFLKVMRRQAVDCSIVAVAARVTLDRDGKTCLAARIAVGAAAPNPFRAKRAEALLTNRSIDSESLRAAGRLAREESNPVSDVRASADYRRSLVETLVERAVGTAWRRAVADGER